MLILIRRSCCCSAAAYGGLIKPSGFHLVMNHPQPWPHHTSLFFLRERDFHLVPMETLVNSYRIDEKTDMVLRDKANNESPPTQNWNTRSSHHRLRAVTHDTWHVPFSCSMQLSHSQINPYFPQFFTLLQMLNSCQVACFLLGITYGMNTPRINSG